MPTDSESDRQEGVLRPDDGFAGRGDDVYEALVAAHAGLTDAESLALNARLVLLLANEVGDPGRVLAAIAAARLSTVDPGPAPREP